MRGEIEGKTRDIALAAEAIGTSGLKRDALELDARSPTRLKLQEELRQLKGKLHWQGNLDELRRDC